MKWKTWAPAILAVVLGLVAMKLASDAFRKSHSSGAPAPKNVSVVAAVGPLNFGQEITQESLVLQPTNSTTPPPDSFVNVADVVGRVVLTPVGAGQMVPSSSLAPRGAVAGLATVIPPGMRALTLNIDEASSQAGMLLPNSRVDVIATVANGKDSFARTLVKNVLVQATGTRLSPARPADGKDPGPFHTATLIVTPKQAHLIDLASTNSRLRFLLRGIKAGQEPEESEEKVVLAEVYGVEDKQQITPVVDELPPTNEPEPAMPPAPTTQPLVEAKPLRTVELINGAGTAPVKFEVGGESRSVPVEVRTDGEKAIPASNENAGE